MQQVADVDPSGASQAAKDAGFAELLRTLIELAFAPL
jgi:hypothetical protein